jgi:hypothetical protein
MWAPRRGVGRPGQVEQVPALGLVQLQGLGEGVQHGLGDPAEVAPLQAGVVVDAAVLHLVDPRHGEAAMGPASGVR